MGMLISLQDPDFKSLAFIPRGGLAGSYGSSILSILRNLHSVFHTDGTILYFHPQCARDPISNNFIKAVINLLLQMNIQSIRDFK